MESPAADIPTGPAPQHAVGVVASFDFTRDRELWRWVPNDTTLYISRTSSVPITGSNLDLVSALGDPALMDRPTREVLTVGADAVLYACTGPTFVAGAAGEAKLREAIIAAGATTALTTSGALLDALRVLDARRVAVVTPYSEQVTQRLSAYLHEAGHQVMTTSSLGLTVDEANTVQYSTVMDLVRRGDHPDADAVFISCTALPTYDVIPLLEQELGKPVVTANQVGIWAVLRAAGRSAVGTGQSLLEK